MNVTLRAPLPGLASLPSSRCTHGNPSSVDSARPSVAVASVATVSSKSTRSAIGWVAAEVGRQPWIVYHLLRTSEAHSPTVTAGEILFSLLLFGSIYLLLLGAWLFLMVRKVRQGPQIAA